MRRAVLVAAERGAPATDADLVTATDELLDERESLTRSLLGSGGEPEYLRHPWHSPEQ
jgi:hypothetical protein